MFRRPRPQRITPVCLYVSQLTPSNVSLLQRFCPTSALLCPRSPTPGWTSPPPPRPSTSSGSAGKLTPSIKIRIILSTCDRFTAPATSRTEKLKLNFVFSGSSRLLPTKLHIEIKDEKGRTVFRQICFLRPRRSIVVKLIQLGNVCRKRQNVYYVKLQEEISTLSAEETYIMTVTSIYGPEMVRQSTRVPRNVTRLY